MYLLFHLQNKQQVFLLILQCHKLERYLQTNFIIQLGLWSVSSPNLGTLQLVTSNRET